jgi:hypothetical protein
VPRAGGSLMCVWPARTERGGRCVACVDSCATGCVARADRTGACEVEEVAGGRYGCVPGARCGHMVCVISFTAGEG